MIDLEFLERLIRAIDESSLDSIELERGGTRVRLAKTPQGSGIVHAVPSPPPAAVPPAPASGPQSDISQPVSQEVVSEALAPDESSSGLIEVAAPMVGTFYRAPAPDAPPYTEKGKRVSKGDTLCIIEAMKLMNELESEVEGTIVEILVDNGQPIEYGQVLFRVDPA
jgi:acetyl-CoA carboxylase biotin carboxyl carrier protein